MNIQSAEQSPESATRQRPALVRGRYVHFAGVAAITALTAGIYSVYSLVLYATYRDSSYDLVIFDQAVRSYAHLHLGVSPIKGVAAGFGPHFSVMSDHFSPVLALLAPLYWIYNGPQTLLVAQAVLFALAIPPLWIFTRRALGGSGRKATIAAYLVSVAYAIGWPLASAAAFDFHEVAFAPVLTAVALERFQAGRLRPALIALAGLLLVKEDMGLLVAGIGIYLAVSLSPSMRKQRMVGIVLVVVGVAYTAFATYVLIPAFGGRADNYWAYSHLGHNVPQVIWHIVRHPLSSLQVMFQPGEKLRTMAWLAGALCFLPLLSPIVLAALPLILERMLSTRFSNWWTTDWQYNAYLLVILVCAAVDAAARLDRWVARAWKHYSAKRMLSVDGHADVAHAAAAPTGEEVPAAEVPAAWASVSGAGATRAKSHWVRRGVVALGCCVAMCLAALWTFPRFSMGEMLHSSFYQQTPQSRAEALADALVPSGVVVEAAEDVGPELSGRDTVLLWDGQQAPLGSPWIVANVWHHEFTFHSIGAQKERVALLLHSGYKIVFQRHGYVVLHRSSAQ